MRISKKGTEIKDDVSTFTFIGSQTIHINLEFQKIRKNTLFLKKKTLLMKGLNLRVCSDSPDRRLISYSTSLKRHLYQTLSHVEDF